MKTNIKQSIIASLLLSTTLLAAGPACAAPLYFPHIVTSVPWQTEIAVINTSPDQSVSGILRAFGDDGRSVGIKNVVLTGRSRIQINIAEKFKNHTNIGYIVFDTASDTVQGYVKFYREGYYRAAIPAVKEVNTAHIRIPHIASNADWWTGLSLVNTTSEAKNMAVVGNNQQGREFTLNAHEHRAFDITSLFNDQPQPDIQSGWITNAGGIIGLELFGNDGDGNRLDGTLLTDRIASTLYFPHVADDGWRTDIVIYNPSFQTCSITITPYSNEGTLLAPSTRSLAAQEKFIGTISDLGLPDETAWFRIDTMQGVTGFELFGTADGSRLAAYAGGDGGGSLEGVFPKIEKNGWTGIAFVNTEDTAASITLTAYNDNGTAVAARTLTVGAHAKVVDSAEALFSEDISRATYMAYSSDRVMVGFQLNGSSDGTMLDALPALVGAGPPAPVWQQIAGPEGGDIRVLAVDPADNRVIYAGTYGGGVFKTTDGGASWTAINTGLAPEENYAQALVIDPADSLTVYVGTENGGVFKTTDGGVTWTAMNTGLTSTRVSSLVIDPSNSQVVYAGIMGSGGAGTGGGVYRTTDGGATWTAMNTGLTSTRVASLAIDPTDSRTIYAGIWDAISIGADGDGDVTSIGGGFYKTTNGGASWTAMEIDTGLVHTIISSIVIDPKNSQTVYAVVGNTIYKTTNGGASWTAINAAIINTGITSFAIDPANSQIIYVGTGGAGGSGGGGYDGGGSPDIPGSVFKTTDGGASWTAIKTGITNDLIYSLAIDPVNSQTVYAGTNKNGVFKTADGGALWTAINTGTNGDVMFFAIDPADSQTVYAGIWNGGVFKTTNGGALWAAMNTGITSLNVQTLAIDPENSRIVYAGTYSGGIFKTIDGGASWTAINTGLTDMIIASLAVDPENSRTVYAGTGEGWIFKTTDGGALWTAIHNGGNGGLQSLAIDPEDSRIVYAGTDGGVFKTTDGGASWMAINTGITNTYILSLAIDPASSRTVYAGTMSRGVFRTINGGASWTAANTGLTGMLVFSLAIDPANSRTVYAGTWGGVFKTKE